MDMPTACREAEGLIFGAEGFAARAYLDALAKPPVWSIGHGTTHIAGKPVSEGMVCTRAQADAWAQADLQSCAAQILHVVKVPLNANQLGALISFVYNIGIGHFEESSVLEALNLRLYRIAADRMLEYDEAGGRPYDGLEKRRMRERALFLQSPEVQV